VAWWVRDGIFWELEGRRGAGKDVRREGNLACGK
jgi:hypothetical protein